MQVHVVEKQIRSYMCVCVCVCVRDLLSWQPLSVQWMSRLREVYLEQLAKSGCLSDEGVCMCVCVCVSSIWLLPPPSPDVARLLRSCVSVLLMIPEESLFPPPDDVTGGCGTSITMATSMKSNATIV